MTEKEIYIDIAHRFINSCRESLDNNINYQEAIGFKAYHAFESLGGAVNCHLRQPVPFKHEKKLNTFVLNYRRNRFSRIHPDAISVLAITLNSLRNKFLYPEMTPSGFKAPKEQLTLANVRELTRRINGLINGLIDAM